MERVRTNENPIRILVLDSSAIHTQLLAEALRRDRTLEVSNLDSSRAVIKTVLECAIDVLVIVISLAIIGIGIGIGIAP